MKPPADEDIMGIFNALNPFGKPKGEAGDAKLEALERQLKALKELNEKLQGKKPL